MVKEEEGREEEKGEAERCDDENKRDELDEKETKWNQSKWTKGIYPKGVYAKVEFMKIIHRIIPELEGDWFIKNWKEIRKSLELGRLPDFKLVLKWYDEWKSEQKEET